MNAQKFVYYGFHSLIFQRFPASRMFFELCQHEGVVAVIRRLCQCSHVGRPRGIKKFAVDKLRSATPVRVSLLSTVEAVATLVIKHRLRELFCCNIHSLTLLAGPQAAQARYAIYRLCMGKHTLSL